MEQDEHKEGAREMILTVTLNPSVDIGYKLPRFELDKVNRALDVSKTAGGKGLNVTRILHQLGEDLIATGFLGGSLGEFIRVEITKLGVNDHFVNSTDPTRNCIAIIHEGHQTEILEGGPEITATEAISFLAQFTSSIKEVDYVTISGSMPKGLDADFYSKLLKIAQQNKTPVLLDTSGKSLKQSLENEHKPFLVKPNSKELAELLEQEVTSEDQIIKALTESIFEDVPWIVVTLGADGALIKHADAVYRAHIPKVNAVNPVGSGDSVIAGFAAGLSRKLPDVELIKFGLSMGVLNAIEEKTGYINPEKIAWCIEQINVEKLN